MTSTTAAAPRPADPGATDRTALLRHPNFRWLMGGSAISMLGDQFTLVALPWLVLRLTGDTVALGTVLALVGVPRALFMLLGGALVDRLSPKRVLMVTKYVNTVLLAVLAIGVQQQALSLHGIYALALGIGIASAFSIPAGTSMLPHALPPAMLHMANGMLLGLRQFSMFLGPLAAGVLIALYGDGGGAVRDATGMALAFALDAFSFALSAWTLTQVTTRAPCSAGATQGGLWRSVLDALREVGRDQQLRACYLYWAGVAILVLGPMHIALPVLADSQPTLGAAALGVMIGAHGAGTLLGMVLAGVFPRLRLGTLGATLLAADAIIGLLAMPLGAVTAAWQGGALMFAIGVFGGFLQVGVFTWMQRRVAPAMVGRATSFFMFIFMGLVPLASAVTGWLLRFVSVGTVFAAAGVLLVVLALLAAVATPIREVRDAR